MRGRSASPAGGRRRRRRSRPPCSARASPPRAAPPGSAARAASRGDGCTRCCTGRAPRSARAPRTRPCPTSSRRTRARPRTARARSPTTPPTRVSHEDHPTQQRELAARERLGVPARRRGFHPAEPHQPEEQLLVEPVLVALARETRPTISRAFSRASSFDTGTKTFGGRGRRRTSGSRTRGSGGRARCSTSARTRAGDPGGGRGGCA